MIISKSSISQFYEIGNYKIHFNTSGNRKVGEKKTTKTEKGIKVFNMNPDTKS